MKFADLKIYLKRNAGLVTMGSIAAICLVSFGAYALLPAQPAADAATEPVRLATAAPEAESAAPPPRLIDSGSPFSFAPLVERVSPAVVSVVAEKKIEQNRGPAMDMNDIPLPFRQFFQGPNMPARKAMSAGSGFIIDKDGLIVTNNHIIRDSTKITVKLTDGRTFDAELVGADAATDVALLKVRAGKKLPTVEFGNDRALRVGDWVVAVGNPFGLSNTVTAGIVSSIGRDINSPDQLYTDFIQIDAPINQGNSGGPTFDLRGQVIGMNSMIFSPNGGSVGIGFAIPASTIRDVIAQLQAHGKVARGWLGVTIQSLTPEMADSLGLKDLKGAIVSSVVDDGPAAKGGVQQGDVIVSINNKPVEDNHDVIRKVAMLAAGQSADIGVVRDGKRKVLRVVIAQRKEEQVAMLQNGGPENESHAAAEAMGMGLAPLTDDVRRAYRLGEGVQGVAITKVDPSSDAAEKGISPGDVLVAVAGHKVHTPQDVEKMAAAAKARGHGSVLCLVRRGGATVFVPIDIGKP